MNDTQRQPPPMPVEDRRDRDLIAQLQGTLRPFINHRADCTFGQSNPDGDYCTCGVRAAITRANKLAEELAALLLAGEGRSEQTDDEDTRQSSAEKPSSLGISAQSPTEKAASALTMPCRECGQPVVWTGLYGDWCAVCQPRRV